MFLKPDEASLKNVGWASAHRSPLDTQISRKQGLLFFEKKKQKTFIHLAKKVVPAAKSL
jgi:hypothetical protein